MNFANLDCDKYQLKDNERLSEDGNAIICTVCGDKKRVKTWSEARNCYSWYLNNTTPEHPFACECIRKRKLEEAFKEQKARFEKVYNSATCRGFIGSLYENLKFDTLPVSKSQSYNKAKETCQRFVEKIDTCKEKGCGIYLWSQSAGTGKSTLMACVRNELIERGEKCLMINTNDLLDFTSNDREIYEGGEFLFNSSIFKNVDILILDDIGVADLTKDNSYTSWVSDIIYTLIETRNRNGYCTLFTSNYYPKNLQTERGYDFKTVDRIISRASAVIEITGTSFRGAKQ